ncbi:Branched-chain-amino-acid aminotransferase [Hondaea fermentalgiana]|uniref:Branched-chain-amino-acid aminotransferase n=1 Tax=Hondaea fermentalgiana TaxID=2315210 RepID=A0A2R5G4B1_9STRA|nr:Branched-chain-amino-acid aminotransferase [Hondaea fermentalgiana]|eukprot:GBG24628.1 Branched-chain-amino-acid aminotransferase [Hondaea fermentalgiana]
MMLASAGQRAVATGSALGRRLKSTAAAASAGAVDPASLDWDELGFSLVPTKSVTLFKYKDGKWSSPEQCPPTLEVSYWANMMHYGQSLFEGLKAFRLQNGDISIFNPQANCARMNVGARRLMMPEIPEEIFLEGVKQCVIENQDYVPPASAKGAALYLRPLYFGAGAQVGLGPANEYIFGVGCTPVGAYYKGGALKPIDAVVPEQFDRAAPLGVGNCKAAGNYAADVLPSSKARDEGYQVALYADAATHSYVEEFSTSNFVAISGDKSTYITPDSPSILESITNKMLSKLAEDRGLKVERRPVKFDELDSFSEVFAVGTAVVTSPISSITYKGKVFKYDSCEVAKMLFDDLTDVQRGSKEDKHGWHYTAVKA